MDKEIYEKLCSFCAYQERCAYDVQQKLYKLKIEKADFEKYLQQLQEDNFLNEERFAKSFVSAHAKKKWGKAKIKSALYTKRISAAIIKKYLDDLDEGEYLEQIKTAAEKKWGSIKGNTERDRKTKLLRFLLSKGYEMGLANAAVKEVAGKAL